MGQHSALAPAGQQALHIAHLWWGMFWTTTAIFVIVMILLFLAVRRGRARVRAAGDRSREESMLTRVVAAAVGATAVILLALLISSIWTGRALASLGAPSAVTVSVYGHQ